MFSSFNPGMVGIHVPFRDGLALAERHGFAGFDAPLATLHDEVERHGAAAVRDLYRERGLRIGAWNLPFMPYKVSEAEWREGIIRLPAQLGSASALGARRAGMWILPGSDERPFEENFTFHVARFQPIARLLSDHGIRLGLEFVGPETSLRAFQHRFIRSVADALKLARAIGPNCGLLLDAWHWHAAGGTRAELRGLTRDQIVQVHIDDAPAGVPRPALVDNRRKLPCTTGAIDIDGFMQALADADYDGPVTAEPFDPEIDALPAEEAAARTARAMRLALARAVRTAELGR